MHKFGAMVQPSRALVFFGVGCMLISLVASDERAPALALYVPPAGLRPVAVPGPQTMPAAPPSVMTPPRFTGAWMPAAPASPVASPAAVMPTTVDSPRARMDTTPQYLPVVEAPSRPFALLGGFVGGLLAGGAFVYSLLQRAGQKVSVESQRLELSALTSVAVESPSVASARVPNSVVVESTALAPYLAGGASLPAVIKQVTSGRTPMPALGSHLRAINAGRGRRVVINMTASDLEEPAQEFCYGLPGGNSGFFGPDWDPAGILENKDKLEVYRLRECELTHGRVGMLASLGFIVQEKFHPLFSGAGGPAIDQMPQLPIWLWAVMITGIGAAESKRIAVGWAKVDFDDLGGPGKRALKEGHYPGDVGFDPLGLKPTDPAEFREMQEKELSHCRLAMVAAAGFIAQEAVSGTTWGAYWGDASF